MLEVLESAERWDEFVDEHKYGHPLQLSGWGEVKRLNKWEPHRLVMREEGRIAAGAQVLLWPIPKTRFKVAYVPRGPVLDPADEARRDKFLLELAGFAKKQRAAFLKIEPAWRGSKPSRPWRRSRSEILLSPTYVIDLTREIEEIKANMRAKTRQYIRKAAKEGIEVGRVTDEAGVRDVLGLYKETAARGKFGLHPESYYQKIFTELGDRNFIYLAQLSGEPVAFLWLLAAGPTAFELYGGMNERGARHHANYLVKAEAIVAMKKAGFAVYDMNGRLNPSINQFKSGFGPEEVNWIGSFDLPISRPVYILWEKLLPAAKPLARRLIKGGRVGE